MTGLACVRSSCADDSRLCLRCYWGDVGAWVWELVIVCEGVLSWAEIGVVDYDLCVCNLCYCIHYVKESLHVDSEVG